MIPGRRRWSERLSQMHVSCRPSMSPALPDLLTPDGNRGATQHQAINCSTGIQTCDNCTRQALCDGGLAHAGVPQQDGIVLGAPRQHLDHPRHLLAPPDDLAHGTLQLGTACSRINLCRSMSLEPFQPNVQLRAWDPKDCCMQSDEQVSSIYYSDMFWAKSGLWSEGRVLYWGT